MSKLIWAIISAAVGVAIVHFTYENPETKDYVILGGALAAGSLLAGFVMQKISRKAK